MRKLARRMLAAAGLRGGYARWLARHVAQRASRYPLPSPAAKFSILTTVYQGTDAALLRATAASVAAQTLPAHEWLILAHGPTGAGLDALLEELAGRPNVRLARLPQNLGISGGMRHCLEGASGEYAVPLDADDLLTADALQVLAAEIAARGAPEFLYSDEDLLIDGAPAQPYRRPDWDPVLNLESSYVWHLCAFRRARALELGVYGDAGTDWCHDWDTVTRFANAGHAPVHVREVLYHWRQHARSSTNRPGANPDSLSSTHTLLERERLRRPRPELFALRHFPIDRGVPEWHIGRRRVEPRPADLVLLVDDIDRALLALGSMEEHYDYRPQRVILCVRPKLPEPSLRVVEQFAHALCAPGGSEEPVQRIAGTDLAAIAAALRAARAPLVWLMSDAIRVEDGEAPWEALRLMELHPQVRLACGRLVDRDGRITPEAGPYVLGLKPHQVAMPTPGLLFAERAFLLAALERLPASAEIAYSPLIRARAIADPPVPNESLYQR